MSETPENQIKVRVVCPSCNKSEYILIDKSTIESSGKGLTTILIPENISCEHSYQIFVDKNGAVRGYETADFELKFEVAPEEEKISEDEITKKGIFNILSSIYGDEIFLKIVRTGLNNDAIVIITEQSYIEDYFRTAIETIMGDKKPDVVVSSMKEYNEKVRNIVYSSVYKNSFVFNAEMKAIIKEPFKKGFKRDKFALEDSILNIIKNSSEEQIYETLKQIIDDFFTKTVKIKELVEAKKISNKKELEKTMQKEFGKKYILKIDYDRFCEFMDHRFGVDPEKIFLKLDEKIEKLKSLF